MKKHISTIALVLALALAATSIYMNYNLAKQIDSLKATLNNSLNTISSNVNSIYSNVDQKLEEKASLLASSSYEYGKIDIAGGTVEIDFSVLPKEYTKQTKAEIVCGGVSYPLEFRDGSYKGSVTVSLYEDYSECIDVVFTDGENVRTETPSEWAFSPVGLLGEAVINENNASTYGRYDEDNYSSTLQGVLEIQYYCKKDISSLKELWLVHEVNGVEKSRTPVPLNTTPPESNGTYFEYEDPDSDYSNTVYYYKADMTFTAPYNSVQAVYIEAVDGNGLRYQAAIGQGTLTAKIVQPNSHSVGEDYNFKSKIVDANGKILWQSY